MKRKDITKERLKYTDQEIVDVLVIRSPKVFRAITKTLEEIDEIEKLIKER